MRFKKKQPYLRWLFVLTVIGWTTMANSGETKTYCIGRMLIEIPVSFQLVRHDGSVYGVRLKRLTLGDNNEALRIANEQIRALKKGDVSDNGTPQIFRDAQTIEGVHVVSRYNDFSSLGIDLNHIWEEDAYFSSGGVVFRASTVVDLESPIDYHAHLLAVANAARPRDPDEIPSEEGTCLEDAFIALPVKSEVVGASFYHPTDKSLGVQIGYILRQPGGREVELEALNSNIGREINVAGFKGREAKDNKDYLFYYALLGQQTTRNHHGYRISVRYFDYRKNFGQSPITEKEADKYWDMLINSIEVRR